jgi:predicted component of type VI protein secretion system
MKAKLKVLRGKLQTRHGDSAGYEIAVRSSRFLVGSSPQCKLCCQSVAISPLHCELTADRGKLWVSDLGSLTGTFVNDVRTTGRTPLAPGDRLRVGRLEFEVVITPEQDYQAPHCDPMSDFVSDLLDQADAKDRARRLADPLVRQFNVTEQGFDAAPTGVADLPPPAPRPVRQPPKKLPPAPELVADDSVQAAEVTLNKMLARLKGPKR